MFACAIHGELLFPHATEISRRFACLFATVNAVQTRRLRTFASRRLEHFKIARFVVALVPPRGRHFPPVHGAETGSSANAWRCHAVGSIVRLDGQFEHVPFDVVSGIVFDPMQSKSVDFSAYRAALPVAVPKLLLKRASNSNSVDPDVNRNW